MMDTIVTRIPNVLKFLEPDRLRFDSQNLSMPLARCVTLDMLPLCALLFITTKDNYTTRRNGTTPIFDHQLYLGS